MTEINSVVDSAVYTAVRARVAWTGSLPERRNDSDDHTAFVG